MRSSSGGCIVVMGAGPPEGPRLTLIQCRGCHGLVWGAVRKFIGLEAQSKTISRGDAVCQEGRNLVKRPT